MSISGGYLKGRRIKISGSKTRPTSALVRQALFDILGSIEGLSFCDLYAGTGIVGFEALSRFAKRAEFVESNRIAFRGIISSLEKLAIEREFAEVRNMKMQRWLALSDSKFDVIFADPPYIDRVMDELIESKKMILDKIEDAGMLVLQLPSRLDTTEFAGDCRKFGDDMLCFIEKV
ncbi:RsmD family RNA methyltransferase [bacterium]|nr:RsmD family RNA methyltransferase [bacterium]